MKKSGKKEIPSDIFGELPAGPKRTSLDSLILLIKSRLPNIRLPKLRRRAEKIGEDDDIHFPY